MWTRTIAGAGEAGAHRGNASIPDRVAAWAVEAPQATALRAACGELSYEALDAKAARLASVLRARGVGAESLVAILLPRSFDGIVAQLAVWKAGGAWLPLDPTWPDARLKDLIGRSDEWQAFVASGTPDAPLPDVRPEDPCDILFTSGTTGEPKGVVATHGASVRSFRTWVETVGLRAGDRYLIVNPFFHTFGYKAGWLSCLIAGATIYPLATLDTAKLVDMVSRHRITVLPGPPAIFQTLLATDLGGGDLSSLRLAVTGAASVPVALIERMRSELGIGTVLTGYGLTESCGIVSISAADDPAEIVARTAGRPIPGVEVRIAEPDESGAGEVVVRGFNVMRGYFEDEGATAEAIDSEGWLHTGDIGRFEPGGELVITDRIKDMYISGGFNCYPAEIERALQRHPDVALAAVVGVPDERLGEVGKAFVVPSAGRKPDPDALLAWARANMANYKAPRSIVVVDSLPLNASGKVQKFALRA